VFYIKDFANVVIWKSDKNILFYCFRLYPTNDWNARDSHGFDDWRRRFVAFDDPVNMHSNVFLFVEPNSLERRAAGQNSKT